MATFLAHKPKFLTLGMGQDKKDTILNGIVRHILTAAGGALCTKGLLAQTELEMAVGAIITLAGVIWSAIAKKKASG